MTQTEAERIITEYLKPIFSFTLKHCRSISDAEDLSQEILIKTYRAMLVKEQIDSPSKFIWTVAHNMLANYYRDKSRHGVAIPIDEIAEIPDDFIFDENNENGDKIAKLQSEIAYLSKTQRQIFISYYFENLKQSEIANKLNIPLGTVKWHLFEAKKDLKRGMDTMRETSRLKFHPIKFESIGVSGSNGTKNAAEYLRSAISQNICYAVRNTAKTINEIADDLGISPVYIEPEVDYLEEYGLLKELNGKYIVNFLIFEPTEELLIIQDSMYKKAAALFANDLFDELTNCGILNDPAIICRQTNDANTDYNFIMWSLIPYIAACSGEHLMKKDIIFDEVSTIRPDGGNNIVNATVAAENMQLPNDYVYMKNWCGPMWFEQGGVTLWQVISEWSNRGAENGFQCSLDADHALDLYNREKLSKEDWLWLCEKGYAKTNGDFEGDFKSEWQVVVLANDEIKKKLIEIGDRIKQNYKQIFDEIKKPYIEKMLDSVTPHLRKVQEFELQYVFSSDGWFVFHCIRALLENGRLKMPTDDQRKSISTIIVQNGL